MTEVAMNKNKPIYTKILENGDRLIIGNKVKIVHTNGDVTGNCLDLRYWYDKRKGFVKRLIRSDKQVIEIAKKWAIKYTDDNLEV